MRVLCRAATSTMLVLGAFLCILISRSDAAEWKVAKFSGSVWIETAGVQRVSLASGTELSGGEQIKTGANGRVMLVRGQETILVSPNSAIALPHAPSAGLKTTILQQAGTILLSVEKRNERHFEVKTPFLAAVVKGTRFVVNVTPDGARVNVSEGRVEVADFRSGQIAMVLPGQSALARQAGRPGLSLSGSGSFEAIRQGRPQKSEIKALKVPASGFTEPRSKSGGRSASLTGAGSEARANGRLNKANGRVRINAPIGELRVNFVKATDRLARGNDRPGHGRSAQQEANSQVSTVWAGDSSVGGSSPGNSGNAGGNGNGNGNAGGSGNGNGGGNGGGLALGLSVGGGNGNASGGGASLGLSVGGGGVGVNLGLGNNGIGLGVGGCPPGLAKKGTC